jgi:hypothetical protein
MINTQENIHALVQRSPFLYTRILASRNVLSYVQVWRTLHEDELYPYREQILHLEAGNHLRPMELCYLKSSYPQVLCLILFTEDAILPGTE